MQTYHLLIAGKVQGVFFRQSVKEQADISGITGIVRNTPDGNVDVVFSADEDKARIFIEWCRRGPKMAIVQHVNIEIIALKEFPGFSIDR